MKPAPTRHASARLVCFDLGGVLVHICDGWTDACRRAGVGPIESKTDPAAVAAHLAAATHALEVGRLPFTEFTQRVAAATGLTPEQVRRVAEAWVHGPFPGVADLLAALRNAGLATACLSNTNAYHWERMSASHGPVSVPLALLTHRFASHEIGLAKPDAAAFEHVERTCGVSGEAILFFDDRAENCRAAAARGWHACPITPGDPVAQIRAELSRRKLSIADAADIRPAAPRPARRRTGPG
ncbi:MAG: HAD family phosphatase [Phycisphaerae bacterium]